MRFDRIQAERDELKSRFTRAVLEVQQRASLKTALLEAKLKNLEGMDVGPRELLVCLIILYLTKLFLKLSDNRILFK